MSVRKHRILSILAIFISILSYGQELITVQDFGTRLGVGINYSINKSYQLSLIEELRLVDNSTSLDEMLSDLSLSYKIDKKFTIASSLRYTLRNVENQGYSNDIRYNIDFKYKRKVAKRLKLKYRLRYQKGKSDFFKIDKDDVGKTKMNFRNKLGLDYKYHKHTFYVSSELFRKYEIYRVPYFNKIRYNIGDEYSYQKRNVNVSFGFEKCLGNDYPLSFYFIETSYKFKMKK